VSQILFGPGKKIERSGQEENRGDHDGGNAHPYSLPYVCAELFGEGDSHFQLIARRARGILAER
jgi:hypothetical protein